MVIDHQPDADRQWAYDKESHVGKLVKALQHTRQDNWIVVNMKKDWKLVYQRQ